MQEAEPMPRRDDDSGDNDRPRRQRRYEDEYDRPRRKKGGGMATGVIIAIILGVVLVVGGCGAFVLVGLLLPAVHKVQQAAGQKPTQNTLKQLALACHFYMDQTNRFPPAAITDPNGRRLLSWRVAILPYMEQD